MDTNVDLFTLDDTLKVSSIEAKVTNNMGEYVGKFQIDNSEVLANNSFMSYTLTGTMNIENQEASSLSSLDLHLTVGDKCLMLSGFNVYQNLGEESGKILYSIEEVNTPACTLMWSGYNSEELIKEEPCLYTQ